MVLIQLLLPRFDNDGKAFPNEHFRQVRQQLLDRFSGLTCYSRTRPKVIGRTTHREPIAMKSLSSKSCHSNWIASGGRTTARNVSACSDKRKS